MRKERVEWVDISKGIGIVLVIIGHCVYLGRFAHNFIFTFHMPMFFILSGLFFSYESMNNCVSRKFKQLIVPYIVFFIIGFVLSLIVPQWRSFSNKELLRDIYMGYPVTINVSSIWFLVCLFISSLLFNAILILLQNKNQLIGWLLFIFIVVMGFLFGRFPSLLEFLPTGRMPLDSDCSCVSLLFLAIGYFFRNTILSCGKHLSKNDSYVSILGALLCLLITVLIALLNGTVNLHGITYHNEFLYISGSLSGFLLIFFSSILIQKFRHIKALLMWLGVNSLKLMGVQAIVLRLYILIVNDITGSKYVLYYLPPLLAVLGSVIVLLISIGVVACFTILKAKVQLLSK